MGDFAQGHIVITARGQGGDEPGQAGHIADCTWYFGTVKVGAESGTVDAKTGSQCGAPSCQVACPPRYAHPRVAY